jgi:hypothetical protein
MSEQPGASYRVICGARLLEQLRRWGRRAAAQGMRDRYLAALRTVQHNLTAAPQTWGDPLFRYHGLGLLSYRGLYPPFCVHYAVDEPRRLVYVQDVQLLPNDPLNQGPP